MKKEDLETLTRMHQACINNKFNINGSPLWLLVNQMYYCLLSISPEAAIEPPAPVDTEEWLTPKQMIEKYNKVMTLTTIDNFIRFENGEMDFIQGSRQNHDLKVNAYRFFRHIYKNKTKFTKTNAKLMRQNYYGFRFDEPNTLATDKKDLF